MICRVVILGLLTLGASACTVTPPLAEGVDPHWLLWSDQQRAFRRHLAQTPLDQRIAMIEADIAKAVVPLGDGLLMPRYLDRDGSGDLHLTANANLLIALAAKYAVTADPQARELGEAIVRGLLALDARSGELDGYIPMWADSVTAAVPRRATHANAYTQLLLAYVMADRCFGPLAAIEQHVSLIYQRFAADDFSLHHVDGSPVPAADLGHPLMAFNARRTLDRRLLDEAARRLGDEPTRQLAERRRWRGPRLGPMHLRLLAVELPTASSTWLNLAAMTALAELGHRYHGQIVRLAARYEKDNNPQFQIIAGLHGGEYDAQRIRRRLEEYPYPVTTTGLINSHRPDVQPAPRRFVKFSAVPEARTALPLYDIRLRDYSWKTNLRQMDYAPAADAPHHLAVDLYQAYWLLALLEQQASNSP